jgi:hypothetical protein
MLAKQFWLKWLTVLAIIYPTVTLANSWRILFYMDSSDGLSDMAFKNITDMLRNPLNHNIELLIQLHAYDNLALRYQVTPNGLKFIQEITLSNHSQLDLVSAAAWGFSNHKADHTMLILSNHGWGILDPIWNETTQKWEVESDLQATCTTKRSIAMHHHAKHKGYMFNLNTHKYLTNFDLVSGLNTIQAQVLNNKALDILALDTCMGAMLEVAYQIAPHVRYLIGSQSCSLRDGFDYQGIRQVLNRLDNNPTQVAKGMVQAFEAYYKLHDDSGIYTHAAFDLAQIEEVRLALDQAIQLVLELPNYHEILTKARQASPRFCMWPIYIEQELDLLQSSSAIEATKAAIAQLRQTHHNLITANCAGTQTQGLAHGSAIYCPFNHIESSYYRTAFADNCQWIKLLKAICPEHNTNPLTAWTVGEGSTCSAM